MFNVKDYAEENGVQVFGNSSAVISRVSTDSRDIKSGDLYVAIRVSENPIFEREGKDLYIESPIPFEISILGGAIKVPTLEGSISLKIPAQTQTGKIFRIRGKGASVVRDGRRGDILCRVIVETPSNLDRKQLKLLNAFSESLSKSKNFPGTEAFIKASERVED